MGQLTLEGFMGAGEREREKRMGGVLVLISSCGVGKIFLKEGYHGLWNYGLKDHNGVFLRFKNIE